MTHLKTMTRSYQIEIGHNAAHYYFTYDPQRETATVKEPNIADPDHIINVTRPFTRQDIETLICLARQVGIKIRKV